MAESRTSTTSPLQIDSVTVDDHSGLIGMTICPGKHGDSQFGTAWNRDLATDLDAIRHWGATSLVTAMEGDEMQRLGVGQLGTAASSAQLQWFHLPITDGAVPDKRFDEAWSKAAPTVLHELKYDRRVVVHCRGGLGRTGMIACLLLVEMGKKPLDALKAVRSARPGTVETKAQEAFVLKYKPRFS